MSTSNTQRGFSSNRSGIKFRSDTEGGGAQVNFKRLVEPFESTGIDDRYNDELPELSLPGVGELYEDCGDDIPRFCSLCGDVQHVGRCCYRQSCPRCWKGWDMRRASTITAKLEGLRAYRESANQSWQGWKFHHIALSPPAGYALNSEKPLQRTFDMLKGVLDELGAATGYLFYHPYRGDNSESPNALQDDRGFWKEILPNGDPVDMDELRESLSFEPHFHAVVLSKHVAGGFATKFLEERTGWICERITKGEGSDVSIYDKYDLARVVTYCLSHTGIGENRAAYRAYGEVANFTPTEGIEEQMGAAVRSVVPNTLGLQYDSVACTAPPTVDGVRVNKAGLYESTSSEPEPDTVPEEYEREECNGRLMEICKAPAFLTDTDWMEKAPHADTLRETWDEWKFRDFPEVG